MLKFIKQEIVLVISFVLAVISCFLVPPSKAYIDYIDFRTLVLLFCLMAVVAGLTASGVIDKASDVMIGKCKGMYSIFLVLCLLPFVASMVVTNDVALITFVPFGIGVMKNLKNEKGIIPLVVVQTIAANMGSILTPIGNPQNLFIQSFYNLGASQFVLVMLPVWLISLLLVVMLSIFWVNRIKDNQHQETKSSNSGKINYVMLVRSLLSLTICLLTVFRVIENIIITLMAVIVLMFGKTIKKVDYALLLTFVCFFVFSGNIGALKIVREFITGFVDKSSFVSSLILSQVISNVPSAVFLSSFTNDWKGLLLGVDIGGLGTPVASLASLISMKFYIKTPDSNVKKYMAVFLGMNIFCLVILCVLKNLIV